MKCLLCLESELQDETKYISVNSSQWQEFNIKSLISKHLWPIETFTSTSCICSACWEELNDFHKFYTRIEGAHCNNKLVLKIEIDPLQEDSKPKDIILTSLLEPEIIIGQNFDGAPIGIKQEIEDPVIIAWPTPIVNNKDSDDCLEIVKGNKQDATFIDGSSDSYNTDDNSDSDDSLPLIRKDDSWRKSFSRTIPEDQKSVKHNDDVTGEKPTTKKKGRPRTKNPTPAVKRNDNAKPSNLPQMNRVEFDKFLKEHFKMTCDKCQQIFERFRHLCEHYIKEHNEPGYALCCGTKFYDRRLLVDHTNLHVNPEYFKCKQCGKILSTRNSLKNHLKQHEEKTFACDICDKKFVEKYKLDYHKLRHMPKAEKKFPCNECGKFYANENILTQHQKAVHLNIYAKVCEICGLTSTDTPTFKKHMEKHDPIMSLNPVKCDQCGLILNSQHTLKLHIGLKHPVGEKCEYKCHICSKISPTMRALKKHIWEAHELGYQFKCTICEKEFKRADNFKSHMAMHTGTPLYRCPWCPKAFNSNGNMHQHRKKAHSIEWEEEQRRKYSGNLPPNYKPPSSRNSQYLF